MALINLVLSIFLAQKYGASGAAFGTTISLVLANGIVMNIYYHKKCEINIIIFWENIAKISLGLIIPIIYGCVLRNFFNFYTVLHLAFAIFSYAISYALSMWFVGMNHKEKDAVKELIYKLIKVRKA